MDVSEQYIHTYPARGTLTIVPELDVDVAIRVDADASAVWLVVIIHFSKEIAAVLSFEV